MMKTFILVFSLFGLLGACAGQFVQFGQCNPNVNLVQNFDIDQFLGSWYEIARSDNPTQNGDCASLELTRNNDSLSMYISAVNDNFFEEDYAVVSHENGTAQLTLNVNSIGRPVDFWILMTDYNNFAVAFSCENISNVQRRVYIWQYGRQTSYPNELIPALINITISNTFGISTESLRSVDHSADACYILPVIAPNQPIVLPGQCDPNIGVVQNFDVARFTGLWHEISSYYSESAVGSCARAEYSVGAGVVDVLNSQVVNQTLDTITGYATVSSNDSSAILNVVLNITPNITLDQELKILATDYANYAISYSCVNIGTNQKRVFSWILSRTRQLSANATSQVNQVVNSIIDLNNQYYQETDQSFEGCFFYPEPVPNQAVVFRGQCENLNISAQANFDPVAYMGLWHDIESYTTAFQDGTCNNAFYTLVNGTVDVFNTQVINQTLDTITAVGVLASTDGSAKLLVTFPVAGTNLTVTTDYWVLDTDYTNYSLVYSCGNIDADRMQVTSWKLSRTKSLSTASDTAINNAISTIPVLEQRYYTARDQSIEGCFYFPEPQEGVPVVFPGQCDENIAVVQNFDFSRFQGVWNEIQAYPKDQQTGQCINHQFNFNSSNLLDLVSSSVDDQFIALTEGTVFYSSNDTSAKLTIRIISDGITIDIPYWVLSTDYTNYALAYSCVNIADDFRAVYSWKLSRTRQLSTAAVQAINSVTANIEVLDDVYYEDIAQTDAACFFLPELAPGEPIILVGQCDPNLTAIQNFDAARYLGRWRLIESYPSEFELGTCNDATYSLAADGSVIVFNTEVINQTLDSITGRAIVASNDGSGVLLVTFPDAPVPFEYYVLDTDYDSYALVYGCVNINAQQRRVWSWKMSRDNTLSQAANTAINQVISGVEVLNNRYYQTVDRTAASCFYYPTPESNTPVKFRASCDDLPVVTNFDAVRYMGLWHDIESYPLLFENGTCPNAFYTLVNGTVDVLNTQVVNQTLNSIVGSAVLTTTDGTAKLNVTFNIGGFAVTRKLWVLATDYDTYAFAYSCDVVDDEYVQISSWKLSRTKSLTAASTALINTVMNTVPVLDQRYYVARDQSADGCFYFPEPNAGVPVVFPGQCDTNITAVPNFSMSLFQGLWYEIEAYPKDDQPGQCINHQFSLDVANTLSLQSSNVFNQALDVTNSNVTFASTDGSGRLTINIMVNGTALPIPYWILSTDYMNYALAYSCVNLNNDQRGVWSWKLSRTKQLTTASAGSINNAIANVDVLDNVYYEPISQTDQSCFYLPDLAPGEPVVFVGQCEQNITVMQNFDAARYLGRWFLIETYPSAFQRGTCNDATYTLGANGTVVVFNTEVVNQTLDTITGSAVVSSVDGSGKLLVTFPDAPAPIEYWILDTDYETYTLVYSCVNLNAEQRQVWSWKMGRSNTLSQNATTAINQVINRINVLDNRYYDLVDRSYDGCFYFPTPNINTVVRFRGQCDENLPVVTNFDAVRYMGLWHDIESYPAPFQDGSCPNAFYTLVDGTVDVFNTQVVNQTLDIMSGFAVLATTDGSAKLNVTFNVAGFLLTTSYWVLDTDYDSYALVYSCSNIDAEYSSINSWKLSRTKALSTAAVTAINNVTNNIQVLDQRYYVNRDQSADACFYFPEPVTGVPVVFPGQCDTNITAVPNFSMSQFQGLWYEIEAYPKDDQPGQCINHQFSLDVANTLSLQSSNVFNQALDVTNSNVTFASTDGSGRLTINIMVNGTAMSIPYWILSTDYNNYALAYSCVNLNNDQRGVWSWKLSRTKQLTTASGVSINNAIANVDVLDNVYYEPISQTDQSCFYLPDLAPGEPVVFVGQCEQNITVMQNFDAARYLGRWRLIETYPSGFQLGTCNEATYSLANDGTVIVYNTEVINETLSEIYGSAILSGANGTGKLTVTFPNAPEPIEYWILDTDYETYTLIYSCANLNNEQRRVWSWKMSRTNSLTQNATNAINQVMSTIDVLNNRYFEAVDRSDAGCFYYPSPTLNGTVVFPGQCNQNITVVTNFDAVRYAGVWYDIASYPAPFQTGTCSKAEYILNSAGTVDVINTQVVDQVLETWLGNAAVASTDGTAKLDVTFNVNGINITTNYWVLATDYSSYALVYSCRNIDQYYREVFSWKLSRQPTLTAVANTNINNAIANVQVLDQQYYLERGHSDDDCFFYPNNFGGDVILDGQCVADNQVLAVTNFNVNAFAGTWHEVSRFPSDLQVGECAATQFSVNATNTLGVTQTIVYNERQGSTFTLATASSDGRGVISASISGVPFESIYILATDYSEYALAYSCRNLNNDTKQIYSWKLSRSRSGLSNAASNVIDQVVSSNIDLFEGYYRITDQSNNACFFYPVFDTLPSAIILPGPCNESISGIPNFDAASYLGRWIEIAKYPQPQQLGECHRAEYSLGADVVDVYNTQVINQTLLTQLGYAVVASTDGTGLLSVTFVVDGLTVVANYYILATDYTNYALVYSCRNLTDGNRQVSSWKLSRTTSLNTQAIGVMDAVINNTQGLIEEYYQTTSQSNEDCFYVPEVNVNEAPQFRGQCENITGVAGFDAQRYLGWWHEIERYPSDRNVGECISSQYQASGTSYQVVDTSVSGGLGTIVTGTITVSNDGRLRRTLSDGRVEDVWVLATDYETYSLLYSCVNVNTEYRRVWSAKHSKARSLTQAAQTAMAPAITNNRVLYPQFYQTVDQSDTACFFYPTQTGDQVVIPGQCDANIPVVQNFDIDESAGTWYAIEQYDAVASSCVGTRLTVNEDSITVLNFEVVDGELTAVEASATVASTDGSGRLAVTLPVAGTNDTITTTLFILATDYESYALTYSCVNVNSFQRAIRAWKLSRTRTLPATGNTAINNLIAQRQELHQPYFRQISQSDDCEEPSSAYFVKSSIIVMLVCVMLQLLM